MTIFDRAALSDPALTGVAREDLGALVAELAGPWAGQREARLRDRRGGDRRRDGGAGREHALVFTGRLLVTLVYLRLDLPQRVLAVLFGVDKSTIGRAVSEIRPLLARRGFAVPGRPGVRSRTLADVLAYAQAEGIALRLDATETQVRGPAAHKPGRRAFVSGKKNLNTVKTTVISDRQGRTLWAGASRPGRQHDQTAVKTEGIDDLLDQFPKARALVDAGYRGLRRDHKGQVIAPPPGRRTNAAPIRPEAAQARQRARTRQSSARIPVEHAIGAHKQWRGLRRWHHHRHTLSQTYLAAALVSDRDTTR